MDLRSTALDRAGGGAVDLAVEVFDLSSRVATLDVASRVGVHA